MRVPSDRLAQHLRHGLQPLYTVLGGEPLQALEALDLLRLTAVQQGFPVRDVLTVESGFDWSLLDQSCRCGSLFGDKKLVELRLPSGKPGVEGARRLESLPSLASPDVIMLVSLPSLEFRNQQSAWFKALETRGVLVEAMPIPREQLPAWIGRRLALQGQQPDPEALDFLAERVEGNLLAAQQEIRKLSLLFPEGPLTEAAVREAVMHVGRYGIPDLSSALLSGDLARYVRTLRGLEAEGEALPLVLWAVSEELRALVHLAWARQHGHPFSQACKEARVWGPRQKLLEARSARLPYETCKTALEAAGRIDRMIKGVETGEPWDALLELGMALLDPARSSRQLA